MAKTRINEIDLLRFLAALMVVLFHFAFRGYAADGYSPMPYPLLAPFAKYGYLGVQLFFIISGFVILMTAASGSLRNFFVSRIVRLYPAFWISCTLTFLAILTLGGEHFRATIPQYLVNMTMLSEFVRVRPIDGVYWSLFVELKFYALVFLVLLAGRTHQAEKLLVAWLLLTIALEVYPISIVRYVLITDYAVYFIAGAISYLIWSRGLSLTRISAFAAAWLVALKQSLSGLSGFETHYGESLNIFVVSGIVSVFLLTVLLISLRKTGRFAQWRWAMAGAITYPLYLIHQKIGYMLIEIAYPAFNAHVVFWGTLLIVLALSFAIHFCIERKVSAPLKRLMHAALDVTNQRMILPSVEFLAIRR
jgi:peptidoglycan/LPS O-acetylase OafA/YrhL